MTAPPPAAAGMTHGLLLSEVSDSLSPKSVPEPIAEVSSLSGVCIAELSEEDAGLSVVDDEPALLSDALSLLEVLTELLSSETLSLAEVPPELLSLGTELVVSGIICGVDVSELVTLVLTETGLLVLDELLDGLELEALFLFDVVVVLLLLDVVVELLLLDEVVELLLLELDELLCGFELEVLEELLCGLGSEELEELLEELEVVSEPLSSRRTYFMLLSFAYCAALEPEYV